ncbi:MAG TPA: hypothetical protein VIY68_00455 [Steroidobacteraceae bacterium]
MRNLDFTSWQALLSTLLGLSVIRERENRQINERLRTLIAAYKTLGGSFTGDLAVDPSHLKSLRRDTPGVIGGAYEAADRAPRSDRSRRMRKKTPPGKRTKRPSCAWRECIRSEPRDQLQHVKFVMKGGAGYQKRVDRHALTPLF